jgi:hypothetical protein
MIYKSLDRKLKIETFAVPVPIMTPVIPLLNINVPCILKKSSEEICIKCRKKTEWKRTETYRRQLRVMKHIQKKITITLF